MHLYHERLIRHHVEDQSEMSVQSEANRLVKFRERTTNSVPRRKSMSILKKNSAYLSPRKSRPRTSRVQPRVNLFGGGQDCENETANEQIKNSYLEKLSNMKMYDNYEDQSFPHTMTSIFPLKNFKKVEDVNEKIIWKRIPEIFGSKDLVLWANYPTGIIKKGSQYCCQYMPMALNCLRGNKALLRYMFERQVTLSQGIYYVKLFIHNKWQYVIIDDYIPVLQNKKGYLTLYTPLFSYLEINKVKRQPIQIWFYLLEKAYAKVYSNYENIQRGNVSDFLTDVTGYPCSIYFMNQPKMNWVQLFKRPQVLVIGATPDRRTLSISKQPKSSRLYFYNNPKSKDKTTILPDKLKRHFAQIYVWGQNYYSYWGESEIRESTSHDICARSFRVQESMKICLNLTQKDERFFPKYSSYQYSWIRFVLLEKQFNGGFRWIDGQYSNNRTLSIEVDATPGEYIALIIPEWAQGAYPLGMIIKSSSVIKLIKENYQQGTFQEACADLAQRFGKFNQLSRFLCSYNCYHEEMGMIVENINNEKMRGQAKIRRVISGANQQTDIYPFNKQFRDNVLEIDIKADKCYTVILLTREGAKQDFMREFRKNGGETPSSEYQNI